MVSACVKVCICAGLCLEILLWGGGQKFSTENLWGPTIQVAYQVINFKEGQNPSNGEVDAPLCPPLNEALSVRMCRRHACMSQRRRKDFLIGGA